MDTNFCFPVKVLNDEQIKLVPFKARQHAPPLIEGTPSSAEAFEYGAMGPYESVIDFVTTFLSEKSYPDPNMFTFAIICKFDAHSKEALEEGQVAGRVPFANANAEDRSVEIGFLQILPAFQGQGIATKAGRLLLEYGMSPPETGGLGLVRMVWQSNSRNEASIKVARRLGFKEMATLEYEKCLKDGVSRGKIGNGKVLPPGSAPGDVWRDSVIFSMTWLDWEAQV